MIRMPVLRGKIRAALANQPNTLTLTSGDGQSATVATAVGSTCTVTVKDQTGTVMSGVPVLWGITEGGSTGSINDTSSTNGSGIASTTPTMGQQAGSYILTASVAGLPSVSFTLTATAGTASTLSLVDGDNQVATVGQAVAIDPSVKVTDDYGNAKSGVSIAWAVASGGGSVNTTGGTTTGADGVATVTSWTLGASAGSNTLTASSAGLTGSPLTFTASGQSAAATQIVVISGQTQSGVTAGSAAAPWVLEVRDGASNPVQGFSVEGVITSGNGSLSTSPQVSAANGRVSFTYTTAQSTIETATLTVLAPGLTGTGTTSTVANVAGALAAVQFAVQPQSNVTTGVTWTQQPSVKLVDQYGNTRLTDTANIALTVSAGTATFSGTTSGAATAGVKAFTGLAFSAGSGIVTVRATATVSGFTVDSNPISVSNPIAHHLTISTEPTTGFVGQPITPTVTVRVEASDNALVTGSTALITASKASGSGTLSGTLSVNAVGGVAAFSNLILSAADTYTLTFASSGLTSDTSGNVVVAAAPSDNEPGGLTTFYNNPLTTLPPLSPAPADAFGWKRFSSSNLSVGSEASFGLPPSPVSPGSVLRCNTPANANGGSGSWLIERPLSGTITTLYTRAYFYFEPGLTCQSTDGTPVTGMKLWFFCQFDPGTGTNYNHYVNLCNSSVNQAFGINTQGNITNRNMHGTYQLSQNRGKWLKLEWLMIANTGGNADGTARTWVDGTSVLNQTNVQYFLNGHTHKFNYAPKFSATWGGSTGPGPDHPVNAFALYADNWYSSGS
jgi:hypothetical protein